MEKPIIPGATRKNAQIELAFAYARQGTPVFPVSEHNKCPRSKHGYLDASCDEQNIFAWWSRWPNSLVGVPTGPRSGYVVLDVDGMAGREALASLLQHLRLQTLTDLTPGIVETPSYGLHLYFRYDDGTDPRSRASDIAPGLDSRAIGGSIIAAGNELPTGKRYRLAIGDNLSFHRPFPPPGLLPLAPLTLIYLMTFGARQRAAIARDPKLRRLVLGCRPTEWSAAIRQHHLESNGGRSVGGYAIGLSARQRALDRLAALAIEYGSLADGRRVKLFKHACQIGKYVHHGVLNWEELRAAFIGAAAANGALVKYGARFVEETLKRGLFYSRSDAIFPEDIKQAGAS